MFLVKLLNRSVFETAPCGVTISGLITSVAAAPRSTNCPHSFSLLQTVVHEHAAVPAHSPHASMRPACTIDNAGPVRWMSEVSLPTSVAYNAGTLVQHRSVECQRYRCLRALPTSHCDESLPTSHCDESLVRAIDNAGTLVQHRALKSECDARPVLNRTHTSRQRLEDATEPLLASMRPA